MGHEGGRVVGSRKIVANRVNREVRAGGGGGGFGSITGVDGLSEWVW